MFLLLHLIAEEGVDEESFTLLDDTSIAVLIPRTFNEEAMNGTEDLTTSSGSVLQTFLCV